MKKKSLKLNMLLNGIRSALSILFPLITFPYVSRVLGVEALGKFNFSNSIINYIILIAGLGISTYAIREGARIRDKKEEFQNFANQIFTINMISTLISYIIVFVLLLIPSLQSYCALILILSIQVIFRTIGVDWLYSIYEDYLYITIRSIVFQILSIIFLFMFVHSESDLIFYTLIIVFANVGSNLLNYIHSKKYCNFRLTNKLELKKHLSPILILFASQIAIVIYVSSDVTILGFMKGDYEVGIYSVSVKIYTIIKTFLASMIVVSIPRLSNILGTENNEEFKNVANDIYKTILTISLPAIIGLIILRKEILLIIAGEQYLDASLSLVLLSIAIICYLGAYFWGQCILVPNKEEQKVLYITIISAILNIVLNFILIPIYGLNAAAFTTIVGEGMAFILCKKYSKNFYESRGIISTLYKIIIGCVAIVLISLALKLFISNMILYLIITIVLSAICYFGIEILLKNESLGFIKEKILSKFKKIN